MPSLAAHGDADRHLSLPHHRLSAASMQRKGQQGPHSHNPGASRAAPLLLSHLHICIALIICEDLLMNPLNHQHGVTVSACNAAAVAMATVPCSGTSLAPKSPSPPSSMDSLSSGQCTKDDHVPLLFNHGAPLHICIRSPGFPQSPFPSLLAGSAPAGS